MKKGKRQNKFNTDIIQDETFFRRLIDSLSDYAIFILDPKGHVMTWNAGAKKILGYSEKEIVGKHYSIFFTEEDIKQKIPQKELSPSHPENNIANVGWRIKKNGKKFWASGFVFPFHDSEGTTIGFTKIMRDRTEHRNLKENQKQLLELEQAAHAATKELVRNEKRLDLAQKAGKIGTFEWLIQEDKIIWTPELEVLYGLKPGEFKGTYEHWKSHIHPEDMAHAEYCLQSALKNKTPYNAEFRIIQPNGTVRWILARGDVYYDKKNKPLSVIGINTDVTDRKSLEQQKDVFIGIASHELRTPVTSLKLFSDILINQATKNQQEQVLKSAQIIKSQTDRLMRLVDDLLDVSKIEAGKLEINPQPFDLNELCKRIIIEMNHLSEHTIELHSTLTHQVRGDRERIGQVIMNLISNAIKYSPRAKKVIIKVYKKEGKGIIEVTDFGIGIPKHEQAHIFDRFFRTNDAKDKNISGFGLGLHISSEIIRRHGGDLRVTSSLGKGSTFAFSLPLG